MTASSPLTKRVKAVLLRKFSGDRFSREQDHLAIEEPLEIRVEGHSLAVMMRTPGEDRELAAGFLLTEGLIHSARDVAALRPVPHCLKGLSRRGVRGPATGDSNGHNSSSTSDGRGSLEGNVIEVRLNRPEQLDLKKLTRHVFSSSSCGVCSKASIEAVRQQFPPVDDPCAVEAEVLLGLPHLLAAAQETFRHTGGLHACALFDLAGTLLVVREDVGRHNALDKVIGWALLSGRLPLRKHLLLLSGRASFELLQKALAAGIPVVAAISAPSSLAVEFAESNNQTLIGFVRGDRMNIYTGADRVRHLQERVPVGT